METTPKRPGAACAAADIVEASPDAGGPDRTPEPDPAKAYERRSG